MGGKKFTGINEAAFKNKAIVEGRITQAQSKSEIFHPDPAPSAS